MRCHPRSSRTAGGDEGVALLIALAFVGIIALLIGALLTQSTAQFKASKAFGDRRGAIYAADAGLEHAVAGIGMIPGTGDPGTCTTTETIAFVGDADASSTGSANLAISFPVGDIRGAHGLVIVAVSLRGSASNLDVTAGSFTMRELAPAPVATRSVRTSTTQLFYALEADLPPGNNLPFTLTGAGSTPRVMHVSRWTGVEQAALPAGAYAWSTRTDGTSQDWISTTVTPPAEGALVYSAAAMSWDNADMDNDGAGTRLSSVGISTGSGNNGMQFGASYGVAAGTSSLTVTEDFGDNADPATHALLMPRPHTETSACPGMPTLSTHHEGVGSSGFLSSSMTVSGLTITAAPGQNRAVIVAISNSDGEAPSSVQLVRAGGPTTEMNFARSARNGAGGTFLYYALDGIGAPGSFSVRINHPTNLNFFESIYFAVHASSWTGVLQTVEGVPQAPSSTGAAVPAGSATAATTNVRADAAGSLVFAATGHVGGGSMTASGTDRLTDGPEQSGATFGTSYKVTSAVTDPFTVTETYSSAGTGTTQAVAVFRPATWAPMRFGGQCESGIGPFAYNDFSVEVSCTRNAAGDTLTLTSIATPLGDGPELTATATVQRLPSGTIEITEWDTRTGAGGSGP
jgi:hypothetical protein